MNKFAIFLCIFLCLLLQLCTSFQLYVHPSLTPSLPRNLKAIEKAAKTGRYYYIESEMKAKEEMIGELKKKDVNMMQKNGEKWREWEEVHEPSDLFTMDYRRVRRRRPIHNKSFRP